MLLSLPNTIPADQHHHHHHLQGEANLRQDECSSRVELLRDQVCGGERVKAPGEGDTELVCVEGVKATRGSQVRVKAT